VSLLKQILFYSICSVLLTQSVHAGGQQQDNAAVMAITLADTTIKKDTAVKTIPDPKQGFKNLFVTTTLANGIRSDQLNPMALSFVKDYVSKNERGLKKMKNWGKPYFDMMDRILGQHGLPKELKYLAVIESGLKTNAISWAGAVGPWALMPATAREYGLKVSRYYDERTDYYKSTHAACQLLTDLFVKYGDWLLVIAAYNGGPGNVNSAIRRSGSKDFWALQYHLPAESMNHVKKFIATHYIMEGEGGITTVTKNEARDLILNPPDVSLSKEEESNSKKLSISGRYISVIIVKHIAMELSLFNRYNPGFDKQVATNGTYEMRLPADKMELFLTKKYEILNESMQLLLNPDGKKTSIE
jgi:membrane-bound lytic murein transglycosylase D